MVPTDAIARATLIVASCAIAFLATREIHSLTAMCVAVADFVVANTVTETSSVVSRLTDPITASWTTDTIAAVAGAFTVIGPACNGTLAPHIISS